ncbi:MAG TPA: MFS transporter [Segeticoccus sp.]|uniref:MFS transporter n=1 Tax=Segeticoccus sp. TaxID=2706531 RepID=UPI002D7EB3E2|nr:MFS transporter [Segeticoccus sp.]HET8599655.1 MFS transporter [Segeticoccus sp.]
MDVLARLDRIPVWALPKRYLAIIGIGYFFTFYDITDIGFAMPAIDSQFKLSGSESLFVALSIGLIGYIVGSLVIGTLADAYGRYRMLILTITLTAIGSFGDAAAQGLTTLIIFRFITGVGVGADLNLVSTYLGELAPAGRRGRISVYTFLVGIIGQAVTPFVALALVPNVYVGWRMLFVIGGVIAAMGLAVRFVLPESPRWEVQHGRDGDAETTVARMEAYCREQGIAMPDPQPSEVSTVRGVPLRFLFHQPYAGRLAVFIPMWFLWYIGNYGFLGDAATLIKEHGAAVGGSILYLAIGSIGYPVGAALMIGLVDRVERRLLILGATIVWLVGMLLIGWFASAAVIYIGAFLASLALGSYLQVAYTFTAESFPTRARSTGFAFSDGIGHAGGALGALVLPIVVGAFSFFVGFAAIGVTGLLAGLVALVGPAATGRRLEHVSI